MWHWCERPMRSGCVERARARLSTLANENWKVALKSRSPAARADAAAAPRVALSNAVQVLKFHHARRTRDAAVRWRHNTEPELERLREQNAALMRRVRAAEAAAAAAPSAARAPRAAEEEEEEDDDEDADLNDPFEMKTQPGGLAMGKSPVFYKDTPASMLPETRSPTRQSQFSFAVDDDD